LDIIQQKLSQAPLFTSRIKKLIVLDREEEDITIQTKYLSLFDTTKPWTGLDIFKQFNKINMGLDAIQAYEKEQGFTYDYVIKMRCDMIIDLQTIPVIQSIQSIQSKELFVTKDSSQESINDHIFICNSTAVLKSLPEGIVELFFKNQNNKICESVHTMLAHICKNNGLQVRPTISSNLNRNFTHLFDTTITLVTAFYDIGRGQWDTSKRTTDVYFRNCEKVLKQRYPLYIFTTEEFKDQCAEIRRKTDPMLLYTHIIVTPYEELHYYKKRDLIQDIQTRTNTIHCSEPEYTKPDYIIVIFNKLQWLKRVSTENPYQSIHFQWIDFGIHDNIVPVNCSSHLFESVLYMPGRLRLSGFLPITTLTDRAEYYSKKRETVAAGFVGGDRDAIDTISRLFEQEVDTLFTLGFINQEQYIYYWLLCQQPALFDYYRMDHWNDMGPTYLYKNNIRVALCFSGHIRSYEHCRQNIEEKIIGPLKSQGLTIHSFLSSWSEQQIPDLSNFTETDIEVQNIQHFQNTYNTDRWRSYSQYSGTTTCPNSVSMHYKISKSLAMATTYSKKQGFTYDIIVRIRPDVKYDHFININLIKESLWNQNTIYMPCHHGKYGIVSKFISDQFFFGNAASMEKAMTVYDNIDALLKEDCPHTGEGFLWKQIQGTGLVNKRFMMMYGFIRGNLQFDRFV
jgi:hypothetical protein